MKMGDPAFDALEKPVRQCLGIFFLMFDRLTASQQLSLVDWFSNVLKKSAK